MAERGLQPAAASRLLPGPRHGAATTAADSYRSADPGSLNLDPDTWNLKHNGPRQATAYIELPQSSAGDIVVATVRLFVDGTPISAETQPANVGDHDGNGVPDLMVKFDGQALSAALTGNSGNTGVRIIGYLVSGDAFAGDDVVNVKS